MSSGETSCIFYGHKKKKKWSQCQFFFPNIVQPMSSYRNSCRTVKVHFAWQNPALKHTLRSTGLTLESEEVSAEELSDRDLSEVDDGRPRPSLLLLLSVSGLERPLDGAGVLLRDWGWGMGFFTFLKDSSISVGPLGGLGRAWDVPVPLDIFGDWSPEQFLATGIPSPPSTDWIFLSWAGSSFCKRKNIYIF